MHAESLHIEGAFAENMAVEAAHELSRCLGGPARVAFVFFTPDYQEHWAALSEILRVDGRIVDVVGCMATGTICGAREFESSSGFSVLALRTDRDAFSFFLPASPRDLPPVGRHGSGGWILLANPHEFAVEEWLNVWNGTGRKEPVVGGLASGNTESAEVFLNHHPAPCVLVGVELPYAILPVLSQGCRPIGEPLTVTKARDNIIYALGAHPAYQALETAFEGLSEDEKKTARGNLFAGLAGTEYVDEFRPGDFLVRNILGADPSSGAVVIGGIPRVGQTLQYQLRNKLSADSELRRVLHSVHGARVRPAASLAFSCLGRGRALFDDQPRDGALLQEILGDHPSAGLFCNGEIAPVGKSACVHSYSLACALFLDRFPPE
ncbi:MAG: FIST C-terminal domain-containing protein [Terrimicrobiaceae bacterium]